MSAALVLETEWLGGSEPITLEILFEPSSQPFEFADAPGSPARLEVNRGPFDAESSGSG